MRLIVLILPLALSIVVLNACVAPISKNSLRQQVKNKIEFQVERPYQKVFDDLLVQTRACYLNKPQVRQITVVGTRDNGKKNANITVEEVYAMAEHDAYLVIDVVAKSATLSKVSVYISTSYGQAEINSVKAWVLENNKDCKVSWLS